jgi:hypothetical protein
MFAGNKPRHGVLRYLGKSKSNSDALESCIVVEYFKTSANFAVPLRIARYKSVQAAAQCDWHMPLLHDFLAISRRHEGLPQPRDAHGDSEGLLHRSCSPEEAERYILAGP